MSLEVSPHLAHDATGTMREARRFRELVDRPNLLVKVPGTMAVFLAIEQLLYEGISINVTLLFSLPAYEAVIEAYLSALERRSAEKRSLKDCYISGELLSAASTDLSTNCFYNWSARAKGVR